MGSETDLVILIWSFEMVTTQNCPVCYLKRRVIWHCKHDNIHTFNF